MSSFEGETEMRGDGETGKREDGEIPFRWALVGAIGVVAMVQL
jgi:hypothetical protein